MDSSDTPTFARTLRDLRMAAGLSQESLAHRSGLSLRGVSDLERGARKSPRLETVRLLAEGLGLGTAGRDTLLAAARPRGDRPRANGHRMGLPRPLATLVGRDSELRTIERLLLSEDVPLVTLTGPGGVGKTSLAVSAANAMTHRFPDGVFFVPLGPLIDPRLVVLALGEALGVRESHRRTMVEVVRDALRNQRALLVFDNFEHLMGAATLVADLLSACAGIRVLVTSRERLRLHVEHVLLIHPLGSPDPAALPPIDVLPEIPAVQLFLRRVRDVVPDFRLTDGNGATVAAICHRLDGLPLALELAASWVRVLSPDELLARLDQRLSLLTRGPRDAEARHQTLRNAIEWSYQLLSQEEQGMFRRMGVFVGGADLLAAEAIAAWSPDPAGRSPVEIIASLVDKSLLRRADDGTSPRFTMLETIREFALDELDAAGEREATLARHAAWYVDLGQRMQEHLLREVDSRWLDRLEVDHGNLRNALVWTLVTSADRDASAMGLRLARSIWLFWYYHSHLAEGRWWLDRALAVTSGSCDADRAMALVGLGTLAHAQGDEDASLAWLTEGLQMAREVNDPEVTAFALSVRGNWAEDGGDYEDAERYFAEANRIFASLGDTVNVAITGYHLGVVAFGQGRIRDAERRCLDALALSRQAGDSWGTAVSLAQLGLVRGRTRALGEAADHLDEALTLFTRIGSRERIADTLCRIAVLASASGDHRAAVRLFADSARLRGEVGTVQALPERASYEAAERASRAALPDSGATPGPERAVDEVIEDAHLVLMDIVDASARRDEPP